MRFLFHARLLPLLLLVQAAFALPANAETIFAQAVNYAVGDNPSTIVLADLNGDGISDLVTANFSSTNVSVLMSNGDGTFAPAVSYRAGTGPRIDSAADLDGDGDIDLAVGNQSSHNISILLNNGNGTFAAPVNYAAGTSPFYPVDGDLDGDGDIDLVTTNFASDNISVFLNNGNGTFAAVNYAAGDQPRPMTMADLDGDTDLDLAVANGASDNISVFLNNGNGTFAAAVNYAAGDGPNWMVESDLDGDGDRDLVTTNGNSDNISVFLNNGNGTFAAAVNVAVGDIPLFVVIDDLDGDGDEDAVVSNFNSSNNSVLLNNGNGTFAAAVNYASGGGPIVRLAADLDADGDVDVVTANYYGDNISVLFNNGNGTFAASTNYSTADGASGVAAADLDNDGDQDLISYANLSDTVSVLLNLGPPAIPGSSQRERSLVPSELEVSILPDRCTTDNGIQLLLHAHDTAEVKIGNLPDLSDAEWQPFEPGVDRTHAFGWELPEGDGMKTVYVQFKGPFFDLVSPILSANVQLDETTLCQSAQEHAHIVDQEGRISVAEASPACLSDYEHILIEPYIVTIDGVMRGIGDAFVRISSTSTGETEYGFEAGDDFSYEDAVLHIERINHTVGAHIAPDVDPLVYEIRMRIHAADRGAIDDQLLWSSDVPMESREFDLEEYPQLCESRFVPHPHPGDVFQSSSSPVYYFGKDLMRHVFPDKSILKSWYPQGAPIMTVASYLLPNIALGENVTLRPGSLAQMLNHPDVFLVDIHKTLRELVNEYIASLLYGLNWNELVQNLGAALVENYFFGDPIVSSTDTAAILERASTSTIDELWGVAALSEHPIAAVAKVLDGRVEFEGRPYPTGDVTLKFRILSEEGVPFTAEDLHVEYDKRIHLILARDDLGHFQHIHPEERDGFWSVDAFFPESGDYFAYMDIAPTNQPRVILRASLAIGEDPQHRDQLPVPDASHAYFDNPYRLELLTKDLAAGKELGLAFQLTKDGEPYADIRRWFTAYAHVVILEHQNANVFVHVHQREAPENGVLKVNARFPYPGRYTVFVQMDVGGEVRTFPITVDVP